MTQLRLRQPIFPILIMLLIGLQLIDPSRVWMILFVGLTGIVITAYFWAWTLGKNLQLRRETRLGWVQIGGQIEERFTLSNAAILPAPWVEFNDQSTLPEFNASKSTSIGAGYFEQWIVHATCKKRGLYYLGDAKIQTGDPFGIFEVNIHASQRTSVLVLPQITTLPELMVMPSGSFGNGRPRRNAPEQTMHASSVREYYYGDSMRMIHWPTTARTNEMFVRLMESAPEGDWWILLDLNKKYMFGDSWDSIEEQSVTLASSLASIGLEKRKSVGLITNSAELTWLNPNKDASQRLEILYKLALAKPSELDLSTVLEQTQSLLSRRNSLIIITASTDIDWIKTLLSSNKRGIVSTVMLLDTSTFGNNISAEATASLLRKRNILCHVIPRDMIQLPKTPMEGHPSWTWRSMPTGEVVPIQN